MTTINSSLQHVLVFNADTNMFVCRIGACLWSKTWLEVEKAGYTPRSDGVLFVQAHDFPKAEADDGV